MQKIYTKFVVILALLIAVLIVIIDKVILPWAINQLPEINLVLKSLPYGEFILQHRFILVIIFVLILLIIFYILSKLLKLLPDKPVSNDDYNDLRNLLQSLEFRQADEKTYWLMCRSVGKGWGELEARDINDIPREVLKTIDKIWIKYTNGKFGFSVQKKIWQQCGSPGLFNEGGNFDEEAYSKWVKFGSRVGWYKYEDWVTYQDVDLITTGALPVLWWRGLDEFGKHPLLQGKGFSVIIKLSAFYFIFTRL